MEITAIKAQLTMEVVLAHYGLKPDKHHRLLCPFHPDKTPSLQVYPQTNTYCCFSTNCSAGTGDGIEFIRLMEKCTRHEAILKAQGLLSPAPRYETLQGGEALIKAASLATSGVTSVLAPVATEIMDTALMVKEAVLAKLFSYFKKALPATKKAVEYLQSRSLDYRQQEVGFSSGDWHHQLNEAHFLKSCERYGLLKPLAVKGYRVWAKGCIIFPLKNRENKIVSLYGRSTTNDKEQRHFYLAGREGLYPGYPRPATQKLILTESIIDAASLLQQPAITAGYAVLALYGTNGLTAEHLKAIGELPRLEEIIFMLNADEPGEAATVKHCNTLRELLPQARITKVELSAGEDVNSVLCNHDDPGVLLSLINERTEFFVSIEKKNQNQSQSTIAPALPHADGRLDTRNPELLIYDNGELYIEVLGGIKITGLDRMRVTLKVRHKGKLNSSQWYSLDLYNQVQREQMIDRVAEAFELGMQATTQIITGLITELENHRLKRIESLQPKQDEKPLMSEAARETALRELKHPDLLKRTNALIGLTGIVGEDQNRLIAYLVYGTRKQNIPLHVMFLGSSASGKTYLQEKISELIPEEDKIEITQITDNALYYFKQQELQNKLILIEDLDGATAVFYPLRELQTKRKISKTVTLKDSRGNLKTITLTVEGPVCVSSCTTKEKIYEDNANRCILLYTDQGREQDERINGYQAQVAAGQINHDRERQYKELFKNMQRLLRPVAIVNPYAKYIRLPEQVFKPRRTMGLLLGFIEAVTFYHQYQRAVKKDGTGRLYIETTIDDIEAAFTLLKDVLFSKSDELTKATRNFFERLKGYLKQHQLSSFKAQDIRKAYRIEPRTVQRYLKELLQYGYIKRVNGQKGRSGFEYTVTEADEYNRLKTAIDTHVEAVLQTIRK